MAWFRVWNKSPSMPVHVVVSTAGIIQHYKNDVPPGGYTEWNVDDAVWHDFTAIPSNGSNQVHPEKDNLASIAKFVIGGVSLAGLAVGGVLLFIPTGGGSVIVALGIGTAIVGGLTFAGDVAVSITDAVLHPASVSNLYAPHGYNIEIRGGEVTGKLAPDKKRLTITGYQPVSVWWHNNTTGTRGHETAA